MLYGPSLSGEKIEQPPKQPTREDSINDYLMDAISRLGKTD